MDLRVLLIILMCSPLGVWAQKEEGGQTLGIEDLEKMESRSVERPGRSFLTKRSFSGLGLPTYTFSLVQKDRLYMLLNPTN